MISFKTTTLKAVAIVGSLLLLLVVLVAHINVVVAGQRQVSDENDYQSDPVSYDSLWRGLAEAQVEADSEDNLRRLRSSPPDQLDQILARDLSSHWPASGLNEREDEPREQEDMQLSRPVNDPEEFEAKLGRLTNALNHNMPNTHARQQLLLGLLRNESQYTEEEQEDEDNEVSSPPFTLNVPLMVRPFTKPRIRSQDDVDNDDASSSIASLDGQESESSSAGYLTGRADGGSEYIDLPLELTGHQYVQGGAGEGRQLLGPEGTFENVQVIKTDSAIPSYCDPPNPCPIGYTARDGCLEEFVNLASFSREYQAKQKCSCDNEHSLFNCASPNLGSTSTTGANGLESRDAPDLSHDQDDSDNGLEWQDDRSSPAHSTAADKLDTLARTIQNRFGDLASVQRLIGKQQKLSEKQQHQEALNLAGNDDENSDYLVRSARKLSSLDMHHKVDLD